MPVYQKDETCAGMDVEKREPFVYMEMFLWAGTGSKSVVRENRMGASPNPKDTSAMCPSYLTCRPRFKGNAISLWNMSARSCSLHQYPQQPRRGINLGVPGRGNAGDEMLPFRESWWDRVIMVHEIRQTQEFAVLCGS